MRDLAAATIVAKRHLSLARVLASSFRHHHPEIPFFVLLSDEVDGYFDPDREPFRLIRLSELRIDDLARFRFQYSQQELTYALTPYLLTHLLDRGFRGAAYLKQESLVLERLAPALEPLRRRSIVLTPHLLAPLAGAGGSGRELNILQSGVYNVGFLGVAATETARAFLSWWESRLYDHCRHDVLQGLHFEQRWLDLVPAFFEDVEIVRDPGFNVGHWNLPDRAVTVRDNRVVVDGHLGRFFRFSGFDPERPRAVTRYTPRLNMANVGDSADVFRRYRALLEEAGYRQTKRWPYAYGRFDNGRRIDDRARRLYRGLGDGARSFGDPFETAPEGSFFRWLRRQSRTVEVMRQLWWALHRLGRRLLAAFGRGRAIP